jgi:hypothetical protein
MHGNQQGEPKLRIQADFSIGGALVLAELRVKISAVEWCDAQYPVREVGPPGRRYAS